MRVWVKGDEGPRHSALGRMARSVGRRHPPLPPPLPTRPQDWLLLFAPTADLLIKETQRRNTFLLYAEAPVSPAPAAAPSSPPQQHSLAPQRKAVQQGRKQAASPHPQQAAQQPRAPAVVAYLVYTTTGLSAHISKLAVAPDWRRRGVARALVREAVRAAQQERRASSVSLHVDAGNAPALALYRGEGFESEALLEVGRRWQKVDRRCMAA